jgi:four helix bundle protein
MLTPAHKRLKVYELALELVKKVYEYTKLFPKEEQYALVSQLRRAAVSVCSNPAEGSARCSNPGKKRFYEISGSSHVETDTRVEIPFIPAYLKRAQVKESENCLEPVLKCLAK